MAKTKKKPTAKAKPIDKEKAKAQLLKTYGKLISGETKATIKAGLKLGATQEDLLSALDDATNSVLDSKLPKAEPQLTEVEETEVDDDDDPHDSVEDDDPDETVADDDNDPAEGE